MDKYLYRFISFEAFVGLVQDQALTFVLLSSWDDPMEGDAMYDLIKGLGNSVQGMLLCIAYYKTFAQCWTSLAESDAMWRINSHGNRAVRIKIKQSNAEKLDGVELVKVQYSDEPFEMEPSVHDSLLKALSKKRTAFSHENEVRLIKRFRFRNEADAREHIKAFLAANHHPQMTQIIESMFPGQSVEEQVDQLFAMLNIGKRQISTQTISFETIPNFIEGVLVHPLAPNWYVKIVEEFCLRNNIPFEGKSMLYAKPSH